MVRQARRVKTVLASLTLALGSVFPLVQTGPVHAIGSGYQASDVLGQLDGGGNPDFTTSNSGVTDSMLDYPTGAAIDTVHHRVFVGDDNDRVLVFNLDASNNLLDHTADYVLGKPNFTSSGGNLTQDGMTEPYLGLAYDSVHDRLFVPDANNYRILVYDLGGISNGMNASFVLGQPDFTSSSFTTTQDGMGSVFDVSFDASSQYLFVADRGNERVLMYDLSGGISNGMNAAYVLGEPDFTSAAYNTAQNGFGNPLIFGGAGGPESVAYNPTTKQLFVGDSYNARIMVFDLSGGISNGMNAAYVLGQPDFTTSTTNTTQNGMGTYEEGLGVDPTRDILYFADDANNRVLVYDLSQGITNGMNASLVLGQPDFTTSTPTTSQTGINDPETSIAVDSTNNRIYLADSSNNRVLIYNFATLAPDLAAPSLNSSYSQNLGSHIRGTASYSLVSGSLPDGLALDTSTGVLSGTPTKAGNFTFAVRITDNNGTAGNYTYAHTYVLGVSTTAQLINTGTPIVLTTGGAIVLVGTGFAAYRSRRRLYQLYGRQ